MSAEVITQGCRLNAYESEVIKQHAARAGLEDAIIINSCAVTAEAERQLRQTIRKKKRENPHAKLVVTGCAAQIHAQDYAAMDEVDAVVGNIEKMQADVWSRMHRHCEPLGDVNKKSDIDSRFRGNGTFLAEHTPILVNDIMSVEETAGHLVQGFEGQTRAFVQIQNGCNHRCTFCIIPYGRGNSRSVPMGEVVHEVRQLVEHGYKEVVLTGVDISDYGKDLPGAPSLGELCQKILTLLPELPRLRLSSIDAVEIDNTLIDLFANESRLMPHLHISLQAGDDMVLKRMKRRHLRNDIINFCAQLREVRPDIVFGADIIAGFPTETDAMFANTLNLIDEVGLTWLHIFPYSERPGTPAARMPQVAMPVRKERAARLREAGVQQEQAFLQSCIGKSFNVLAEKNGIGRTEHFAPVQLNAQEGTLGMYEVATMCSERRQLVAL